MAKRDYYDVLGVDKNGNAIVETDHGREFIASGEISIKGVY